MKSLDLPLVTIILRGYHYKQIHEIAKLIYNDRKLYALEITLNTDSAFDDIKKVKEEFPELMVGAGTVLKYEQAQQAIASGAQFLLSPVSFEKNIYELCQAKGVNTVPGAMTPSEIMQAFDLGADIVKVFPAARLGPDYFKDLKGPLGELPLMAVGGVNRENAKDYLDRGSKYLGIGSGIFAKKDIEENNVENLIKSLIEFEASLSQYTRD